ncbi:MAG: hypothetical protein MZV64_70555 [Ignavibacteriales bacterium]|nr:hypothetical protein [Ignavibacteriales bacterium]
MAYPSEWSVTRATGQTSGRRRSGFTERRIAVRGAARPLARRRPRLLQGHRRGRRSVSSCGATIAAVTGS